MRRSRTPMRRTGQLGRAAQARVRTGGKLAVGRESLGLQGWRDLVREVFRRQGYRCLNCPRRAVDPHHIVKRSAGGTDDFTNVVGLCRRCHERTDWPWERGRLVIVQAAGWFVTSIITRTPGT